MPTPKSYSIDTTRVEPQAHPGVLAVYTGEDECGDLWSPMWMAG